MIKFLILSILLVSVVQSTPTVCTVPNSIQKDCTAITDSSVPLCLTVGSALNCSALLCSADTSAVCTNARPTAALGGGFGYSGQSACLVGASQCTFPVGWTCSSALVGSGCANNQIATDTSCYGNKCVSTTLYESQTCASKDLLDNVSCPTYSGSTGSFCSSVSGKCSVLLCTAASQTNAVCTKSATLSAGGFGYTGQSACVVGQGKCSFPTDFTCGDNAIGAALCLNNEVKTNTYCVAKACASLAVFNAAVECGADAQVSAYALCSSNKDSVPKTSCLNKVCDTPAAFAAWCGVDLAVSLAAICKASTTLQVACLSGACVTNAVFLNCGVEAEKSTFKLCSGSATLTSCSKGACATPATWSANNVVVVVNSIILTFSALLVALLVIIA